MRWTKIVLIFQAVITLMFGTIFFLQVLSLDAAKVSEFNIQLENTQSVEEALEEASVEYIDMKQRYSTASYILLVVSLIEIMIIMRMFT